MPIMPEILKEQGYENFSLAIQKKNNAVKMYKKFGFKTLEDNDEEWCVKYKRILKRF